MFVGAATRRIPPVAPAYVPPLIGVSTTNVRYSSGTTPMTAAQSMAQIESFCGAQSIHRDYANDTYTTFMTSTRTIDLDQANQKSIRTTHVSWNPDMVALQTENTPNPTTQFSGFDATALKAYLAGGRTDTSLLAGYGTETRKNITWLLTIPTYHSVILNPCHEADEYQASRTYGSNYGAFRNGFRIIADMIHAFGISTWYTCLLTTVYAFKGNSGTTRDPANFWPAWSGYPLTGNKYVDIYGIDIYNEGSLSGTRWDSPDASLGTPLNSDEAASYQGRYSGLYGWRNSDANGNYWSNGVLGWFEMMGVTKWVVGEIGTIRNIKGVTPSWVADSGVSNSKNDWIRRFAQDCMNYSRNPAHKAKCFGLEYFMSAGRIYETSGVDALTTSIYSASDGSLYTCSGSATTSSALPTSGIANGALFYVEDTKHVWRNDGSASASSWTDVALSIPESWQLWWNDPSTSAPSWDSATASGWAAWKDVTTAAASDPANAGFGNVAFGVSPFGGTS